MEKIELPKEYKSVQFSKEEQGMPMIASSSSADTIIEINGTAVEEHVGLEINYIAEKNDPVNAQLEEVKDNADVEIEINGTKDGLGEEETIPEEEEEGSDSLAMFLDDSGSEQSNNADNDESISEVCVGYLLMPLINVQNIYNFHFLMIELVSGAFNWCRGRRNSYWIYGSWKQGFIPELLHIFFSHADIV